jgi:hypothetical protein
VSVSSRWWGWPPRSFTLSSTPRGDATAGLRSVSGMRSDHPHRRRHDAVKQATAGKERHAAFAPRECGTLQPPGGLPQKTERRVRERVVATLGTLLRVARDRSGMVSTVDR